MRPNETPSEDYSFALVDPPIIKSKSGVIVATVSVIAIVAAASYGALKWITSRPEPELEPEPEPIYPNRYGPFYRRRLP